MDGAGEMRIFFQVVMLLVKPAWLTVSILLFNNYGQLMVVLIYLLKI